MFFFRLITRLKCTKMPSLNFSSVLSVTTYGCIMEDCDRDQRYVYRLPVDCHNLGNKIIIVVKLLNLLYERKVRARRTMKIEDYDQPFYLSVWMKLQGEHSVKYINHSIDSFYYRYKFASTEILRSHFNKFLLSLSFITSQGLRHTGCKFNRFCPCARHQPFFLFASLVLSCILSPLGCKPGIPLDKCQPEFFCYRKFIRKCVSIGTVRVRRESWS